MERPSYLSCPSFWKLFMEDDFNTEIRIPHSFSHQLETRKSPCNYSLITDKKRSSDRPWRAKLVKKDNYYFLCKKSWPEFVRDHDLKYGDLLLFYLVDKKTFRVVHYDANGSKRKINDDFSPRDDEDSDTSSDEDSDDAKTPTKHRQDRKHRMNTPMSKKVRKSNGKDCNTDETVFDEVDDDGGSGVKRVPDADDPRRGRNTEVNENSRKRIERIKTAEEASKWDHYFDLGVEKPYFIRTIKDGHISSVVIPRPFARAMNLDEVEKVKLQWEDEELKRSWTVEMLHRNNGRVDIGDGWMDFWRRYDIRVGETCRFSVNNRRDPITISVHVFRSDEHNNHKRKERGGSSLKKAKKSSTDESDSGEDGADEQGDRDYRKPRPDKMKKQGGSEPMPKKARNSSEDHKDYYTEEEESDSGEDGADEQGDRDYRKPSPGRPVKKVDAKSRKEIEEITTSKEASKWDNYIDLAAEKPYFIRTIKEQNKNFVVIPKAFAVENNLLGPREIMLRCEDGDHKKWWRAKISQTKIGRIDIRDGWGEFRREFGIQAGETCRFTISFHRDVATFSVRVLGCHRFSN